MMNLSLIRKIGLIVLVTLFLIVGQSAEGGFQEGLDAARRGDYATALKEWRPLAEQGNVGAQFNLGFMYEKGKGVPRNYKIASKWYRMSAEQGNAGAQYNLGLMYAKGQGVPKDYKLAVKWFRKSAEQGNAGAQSNLGVMYAKGQGVLKDKVRSHMWFNTASANGDDDAGKNRDIIEKKMTSSQIEKATDLAREWMRKHRQ